jgi:sulfate adenylyltransferase
LIQPHGSDALTPLLVTETEERERLVAEAATLPSMLLSSAAAANAVMLGGGYFTPLSGYMNVADAMSVSEKMHTVDGLFWPVPVLNMTDDIGEIEGATRIALRDPNVDGEPVIAVMDVDAIEEVSMFAAEACEQLSFLGGNF